MGNSDITISQKGDELDATPLPLYVAEGWKFSLAHINTDDEILYAVRDWIAGLTGSPDPGAVWRTMKSKIVISTHELPYTAKDGKNYQMDYTDDEGLYKIAAYMRVTKARHLLRAIKDYLAQAGVLVDEAITNPEEFEEKIAAFRHKKYERIGKQEDWIATRELSIITRKEFTTMIFNLLGSDAPFGTLTNDVYRGVFNADVRQLRERLDLSPKENPRDFFSRLALAYTIAAEEACKIKLADYKDNDLVPLPLVREIIQVLSQAVGVQADKMANALRIDIVTGRPLLGNG
jgi:hypothetical protein